MACLQKVKDHPNPHQLYEQRLIKEGTINEEQVRLGSRKLSLAMLHTCQLLPPGTASGHWQAQLSSDKPPVCSIHAAAAPTVASGPARSNVKDVSKPAAKPCRQTLAQAKSVRDNVTSILQREFEAAKEYVPSAKDWLSSYWSGFMSPHQKARIRNTGSGRGPILLVINACMFRY